MIDRTLFSHEINIEAVRSLLSAISEIQLLHSHDNQEYNNLGLNCSFNTFLTNNFSGDVKAAFSYYSKNRTLEKIEALIAAGWKEVFKQEIENKLLFPYYRTNKQSNELVSLVEKLENEILKTRVTECYKVVLNNALDTETNLVFVFGSRAYHLSILLTAVKK